jgi:hypothetical protein
MLLTKLISLLLSPKTPQICSLHSIPTLTQHSRPAANTVKSFTPTEASYNLGGSAEKSLTFPTFVTITVLIPKSSENLVRLITY